MARRKNVIAPEAKAMDEIMKSREQADKLWGDGQPFDMARIETKLNTSNSTIIERMIEAGRDYLWTKAYVNHGEFMALVDRTANSHTYVLNCMRFADMYSNSAPVPNLGVRKTRALAILDKPLVEKYIKGGDLGDIPHDDVAEMTVAELETEVRKLREKVKKTESVIKEKICQKDEQIAKLELEKECQQPPTKEQIAQAALQKLTEEYTFILAKVNSSLREALSMLGKAERIEGVNVQQLNDWLGQFDIEMNTFRSLSGTWSDAIDNAGPAPEWRISDL